jgi:class 3 adenylate cyclase
MRFADGTVRQKSLFALLLGVYVVGLGFWTADKVARVGQPDVGFTMDGANLSPTSWAAAAEGLRGGGRVLLVNGIVPTGRTLRGEIPAQLNRRVGETNTLRLLHPGGTVNEVTVHVRPWEWGDVLYAEGTTVALGLLFAVVGVTSFLLRPYTAASWALLAMCTLIGGLLTNLFLQSSSNDALRELYFRLMVGLVSVVPLHGALAFPVAHPVLLRRRWGLAVIYGTGLLVAGAQFAAWEAGWQGAFRYASGTLDTSVLLFSMLCFVGRCSWLAFRGRDPLVAQRARILLLGTLAGVLPVGLANFLRSFGILVVDMRLAYATVGFFLLALGYITVRHDLLNARIAVRRAVIYTAVVVVLTIVAVLLVAVRPYAVAVLLLPLLYWWPRFDAQLNAWLYPKRTRFPELLRSIGAEMLVCRSYGEVLDILAGAPARLCDARSCVAFLLPGVVQSDELLSVRGVSGWSGHRLADEVLVQLMCTTRRDIVRDHVAIEPQYANIKADCYACFARLAAELLLPIVRDKRVIGGLAIGRRETGDVYETAELDALSTVGQQAVQAIVRVEATERLGAREREFADLKRFFPPQIIDQIMARGGAAELRSQRKLVTVFFADLRGFTSFSDSVEPEEVMATLAEYHAAMGRRIAEFAGTVERFAGDGIMVFFNDPVEQPDHIERAVRMALAMRRDIRQLREGWLRKGYAIDVGMGIHSGYATCGFIGFEGRRDYGVIGNVTNLASRLCDAAGAGDILITARVWSEVHNGYRVEPAGELTLKGFHQAQAAYRLLESSDPDQSSIASNQ